MESKNKNNLKRKYNEDSFDFDNNSYFKNHTC